MPKVDDRAPTPKLDDAALSRLQSALDRDVFDALDHLDDLRAFARIAQGLADSG
jgi:hypothetical protein